MCAGTCRQKYELRDKNMNYIKEGYLLSMKDLNILSHLEEFIKVGIDSLKIEGRMKKPSYIFFITSIYRKAIDSYYEKGKIEITKEEIKNIYLLYNRMFTKGYLFKEKSENIVNPYRPGHMGITLGKIEKITENKIWIRLEEEVNLNDGIRILNDKEDQGFILTRMKVKGRDVKVAKKGTLIEIRKKLPIKIGDTVIKTTGTKVLKEIESRWKQKSRKVPIKGKIEIKENQKIILYLTDGIKSIEIESEEKIEKSRTQSGTKEEVKRQLSKLGNTPYFLKELEIELEDNLFIPTIILSNLRRKAIECLNEKRLERKIITKQNYERKLPSFPKEQKKGASFFYDVEAKEIQNFDYIYKKNNKEEKTLYQLPRIVEDYKKYEEKEKEVLISEVGALSYYPNKNTDFTFHVVNSYTLAYLHAIGVKRVTLSYELNDKQIEKIIKEYNNRYHENPNVEVIVYGYEEAMITKYNILNPYHLKEGYLIDKYKNKYYIKNNELIKGLEVIDFNHLKPILINISLLVGFTLLFIVFNNLLSKRKQRMV